MTNDSCLADARDVFNAGKRHALLSAISVGSGAFAVCIISYLLSLAGLLASVEIGAAIVFSMAAALPALAAPLLGAFHVAIAGKLQPKRKGAHKELAIFVVNTWVQVAYGMVLVFAFFEIPHGVNVSAENFVPHVVNMLQSAIMSFVLGLPIIATLASSLWLVFGLFGTKRQD